MNASKAYGAWNWTMLIFVLLSACQFSCTRVLPKKMKTTDRQVLYDLKSPFYQDDIGRVFDLHIYIQKKHISGLLFFKYEGDLYRFSLLTKTGQKLLDLSTDGDRLIKHHVMEALDKKVVLEQLKKDFALLFLSCDADVDHDIKSSETMSYVRSDKCQGSSERAHFLFDEQGRLTLVGQGGSSQPKRWLRFKAYDQNIPELMTIDHRSLINLRLEFKRIDLED